MCTGFKFKGFFCRNFDYEESYDEELRFLSKEENPYNTEYDIMGICTGLVDYPLFYDAVNSEGLCVSGLSFPNNAVYSDEFLDDHENVASYNIPLFVLSKCRNITEAKEKLLTVNVTSERYGELPSNELHWLISDKDQSIVLEVTEESKTIYNNPYDVLTNNPPFREMTEYCESVLDTIGKDKDLEWMKEWYSRGANTEYLKGSYMSTDRFIRATWFKEELLKNNINDNDVLQCFKLLQSVEQINGITPVNDKYEYTIYSVVYDMDEFKAYVKSYHDYNVKEYDLTDFKDGSKIKIL